MKQIGFHVIGDEDPTRSDVIYATPDGVPGRALITRVTVTNPDKNSMMLVSVHVCACTSVLGMTNPYQDIMVVMSACICIHRTCMSLV
jgi:hypothetical protein